VITGPVWNMYPTVRHSIDAVREGTWKGDNLKEWSMMAKGGASLAPFHEFDKKLPPEVIAEVREIEAKILAGQFEVPVIETELTTD
jgi:basic membrane lipoprotein Med (substrate-binding protein (PBP1-ABC) superfamily)